MNIEVQRDVLERATKDLGAQFGSVRGLYVDVPVRDLAAVIAHHKDLVSAMISMRAMTQETGQLRYMIDKALQATLA